MTTSTTLNTARERNGKTDKLAPKDRAFHDLYPFVAMASLTIAYHLAVGWHPFEDTFITFRYARNLSDGLGLVYNVGERVLGTTTPLYAVILAMLHRILGTDLETLGWVVNLVVEVGNVSLLYVIGGRYGLTRFEQVGICAVYATAKYVVGVANSGMETPLFVAAILAGALAILSEKWRIAGVAIAVAILLRPEGLLAAISAIILLGLKQRSAIRPVVCYVAAICLPWIVVSTWYYGSPIPAARVHRPAQRLVGGGIYFAGVRQIRFCSYDKLDYRLPCGRDGGHLRTQAIVENLVPTSHALGFGEFLCDIESPVL
jgi:hypothetical protein